MGKGRDRTVFQKTDGEWVQRRSGTDKVSSTHKTQKAAVEEAKTRLERSGGGELLIIGRDGKIRSKDTIAPGNDPNPPRDKER